MAYRWSGIDHIVTQAQIPSCYLGSLNLPVVLVCIQSGEDSPVSKWVYKLFRSWGGLQIPNSSCIELLVINRESKRIFLSLGREQLAMTTLFVSVCFFDTFLPVRLCEKRCFVFTSLRSGLAWQRVKWTDIGRWLFDSFLGCLDSSDGLSHIIYNSDSISGNLKRYLL